MDLVQLYDTTLRDGTQAEDIAFLVTDKIRIAEKLDELGFTISRAVGRAPTPRISPFSRRSKVSVSSMQK